MKTYGGMDAWIHVFLTLALVGGEFYSIIAVTPCFLNISHNFTLLLLLFCTFTSFFFLLFKNCYKMFVIKVDL
jgi:hypothetical protein